MENIFQTITSFIMNFIQVIKDLQGIPRVVFGTLCLEVYG